MKHALVLILSAAVLGGCERTDDGYPSLLPGDLLLAEPSLPDHAVGAAASAAPVDAEAEARAAALRARADTLRGPVIEPEARTRLGIPG